MDALELEFLRATKENLIPGVVLAAANFDGTLDYFRAFGSVSLQPGSKPVSSESTFCLASATKLVTSVAMMQCIERGMINLDDEISALLPEWKDPLILEGFDDESGGQPILEKAKHHITIRHLLSHTSGITGLENEDIMRYYNANGDDRGELLFKYFVSDDPEAKGEAAPQLRKFMGTLAVDPLVFEPGTNWGYGQSTDWAGQLIERLTHSTLEEYLQQNVFKPLSMTNTTFRLLKHPHVAENLIQMCTRDRDRTLSNVESIYPVDPLVDLGGSNLYTSAPDFISLLKSLLLNDGKVLRPETVDIMFGYRLPNRAVLNSEESKLFFAGMVEDDMELDHCLAGLVNIGDLKTGRKAGSITWQGATKCYWWIDRAAGLCGFYGSQISSAHDNGISANMYDKFVKAIYDNYCVELEESNK